MSRLRGLLKTDARRFLHYRGAETCAMLLMQAGAVLLCLFTLFSLNFGLGVTDTRNLLSVPPIPTEYWSSGTVWTRPDVYVLAGCVLLYLLIVSPIRIGRAGWYLRNSYGLETPPATPFLNLRMYARALYVSLYDTMLRLVTLLIFILPVWLGWLSLQASAGLQGARTPVFVLLCTVLAVFGCVFVLLWLWLIQRWALIPYLALERPDLNLAGMLRLSRRLTRGSRLELALARLSFIPWFASCILIFPALYALPYYGQTMALYARYLTEQGDAESGASGAKTPDSVDSGESAAFGDFGAVASEAVVFGAAASGTGASDTTASDVFSSGAAASNAVASDSFASDAVASDSFASDTVVSDSFASDTVVSDTAVSDTLSPGAVGAPEVTAVSEAFVSNACDESAEGAKSSAEDGRMYEIPLRTGADSVAGFEPQTFTYAPSSDSEEKEAPEGAVGSESEPTDETNEQTL